MSGAAGRKFSSATERIEMISSDQIRIIEAM
jgi:hypothetical protein